MTGAAPELLAPASNLDAAFVAYDCGADAVYCGLPRFNARERGENFSWADLARLAAYAHRRNRKFYVTLNTLVKEQEIPEIVTILARLEQLRPHAVIVQDLALVFLLREYFPALSLHASTQMGIHNSAGVALAADLGIDRVILERQVTLAEVKAIREHTAVELEVFIHGALCCCRSGACLFSSWLGGWSGNRGKCKQPCRRRFYAESGNGFFFSTNDLYALDRIPELMQAGIACFKIEGRLRRSDYVRAVVTSYRLVMDAPAADRPAAIKEARRILAGALGRKWSAGFQTEADFDTVIQHERLGVSGLLVGKVTRTAANGFAVRLSRPLAVGDRVRVQADTGEEGPGFEVTRLSQRGRSVRRSTRGADCFVHCDKEVPQGAAVFVTSHAAPPVAPETAPLKAALGLRIHLSRRAITVAVDPAAAPQWQHDLDLDTAAKRPLEPARLIEQFRMSDRQDLLAADINVEVVDNPFLPASQLKQLRRAFWDWAAAALTREVLTQAAEARAREVLNAVVPFPELTPQPPATTTLTTAAPTAGITARPLRQWQPDAAEAVLPDFCPEGDLADVRSKLQEVLGAGCRRLRVTSLYGLKLVQELAPAAVITASFPLPVANCLAFRELSRLGVERALAWPELDREALAPLIAAIADRLELWTGGRLPILATRARLPVTGDIADDRGNRYEIFEKDGQHLLVPREPLSLPTSPGVSAFIDLTFSPADDSEASSFNYDHEWT